MVDPLPGDIFRKGQVLNNTYEIEGLLGRGGTGEVYRARNQITGRVVAVKALNRAFSANDAYLELMKREEEMRNIVSDAVVRYTDCSRTAEGHVYLVMDFVDGTPLSDRLESGGTSPRDLLIVAHRVAEGLVATHARKIVHRDLSPDNIILRGGDPAQAVIIDFGIAKDSSAGARTIVGNDFAGKYEYAAPEQMHGKAEPRSDLYALGASLLACFRGRVPDVGGSPGEVIRRKEQPLDTAGVPEPLRGLIDSLTQPDPARRPPSAAAVAAEIETLLKSKPPDRPEAAATRRRRWPLVAGGALAAVVIAVGAWLSGLFSTTLPVASPYLLNAERAADGSASISGNAPDEDGRQVVLEAFATATGAPADPDALTLADGAPVDDWPDAAAALIAAARPLAEWRLALSGKDARLSGSASDPAGRDTTSQRFAAAATSAGLVPQAAITAGPAELTVEAIRALLAPIEDCGPLAPTAPGATVGVTGYVAERATAEAVRSALASAAGDRQVGADLTVLNPELCKVLALLPLAEGDISIAFGYGDRPRPNLSGVYAVGDNPVIDVLMPAGGAGGYLWVAIADVTGNLYNLLPNLSRPESAVATLGTATGGVRSIRVAYSLAEQAEDSSKLAFAVDPNFGKSAVIVLETDRPLFDELRPTTESVASFAEALGPRLDSGSVKILSVSTQFIDSRG